LAVFAGSFLMAGSGGGTRAWTVRGGVGKRAMWQRISSSTSLVAKSDQKFLQRRAQGIQVAAVIYGAIHAPRRAYQFIAWRQRRGSAARILPA
jgi:hypothetical protein